MVLSSFRGLTGQFPAGFSHQPRLDYYMNYYTNLHSSGFEAWADRSIERKMRSRDGTSSASQDQDCPPPITKETIGVDWSRGRQQTKLIAGETRPCTISREA
jgi:hypothetical protein